LWVAHVRPELPACYELARSALDQNIPRQLLEAWSQLSQS
jgi:hypothetical protein